jgi:3-oxoadipate enol-lactonase
MRRLLKRLALLWAAWRLLGPEPQPSFPSQQEHPNRIPGRTVFVGDRELFVREAGPADAPPILLLHGWGDHSLVVWHAVIPLLAEGYRVIALDNRNTGKSDLVRGGYEIAGCADDAAGVLEALGIDRATVAGYSMGGMIAQELARRHPERVAGLVLGGTASTPIGTMGLPGFATRAGMVVLRALGRISKVEHTWLRTRILRDSGAAAPEHLLWFWTQHLNRDTTLYWEAGFAITHFDSAEWVGGLDMLTTVVINTADQLLDPAAQYQLVGRLPSVHEVVEVLDARHEGPLTHPKEYAGAIARLAGTVS